MIGPSMRFLNGNDVVLGVIRVADRNNFGRKPMNLKAFCPTILAALLGAPAARALAQDARANGESLNVQIRRNVE
jgi:hypothetical protein